VTGTIGYLNTDLDLGSTSDVTSLVARLEAQGMFVLHCQQEESGTWHARLETHVQHPAPEQNILAILDEIERLPEELREIWAGCSHRDFSLGYECGAQPRAVEHGLSSDTLGRIAAVGARLTITLYAPDEPGSPSGPAG
jgi:hypothetical protein